MLKLFELLWKNFLFYFYCVSNLKIKHKICVLLYSRCSIFALLKINLFIYYYYFPFFQHTTNINNDKRKTTINFLISFSARLKRCDDALMSTPSALFIIIIIIIVTKQQQNQQRAKKLCAFFFLFRIFNWTYSIVFNWIELVK